MHENNWMSNKPEGQEPQEQSFYQTGSTCPPKNHRGLIAILLVAVIFLGGIVSALGLLNIRLFRQLQDSNPEDTSFRFSGVDDQSDSTESTNAQLPTGTTDSLQLQLHHAPETIANTPQAGGLSLQEIYSKAIPSVVSIICISQTGQSSGTGVVLSSDGYIVTNCHVVDGAESIDVLFSDQQTRSASLIGMDVVSDLAVLYVQASDLQPAEFGDSSSLQVGDLAVAIGDPLGVELRGTMTDGIISAINRDISTGGRTMTLIQTNAALNSGNSGGPLINEYGQVVGINVIKMTSRYNSVEGLGFAIPSTYMERIINDLLACGEVQPEPLLGITVLTEAEQAAEGVWGLRVEEVTADGVGERAGIRAGDFLLTADGQELRTSQDLLRVRRQHYVGEEMTVTLWRNGETMEVTLALTDAVEEAVAVAP